MNTTLKERSVCCGGGSSQKHATRACTISTSSTAGSSPFEGRRNAGPDARPALRDEHQRPRIPLTGVLALDLSADWTRSVRAGVHYYSDESEVSP